MFVGNIPSGYELPDLVARLRRHFSSCTGVRVPTNDTGGPKRFGFVKFSNTSEMHKVLNNPELSKFDGTVLNLQHTASNRKDQTSTVPSHDTLVASFPTQPTCPTSTVPNHNTPGRASLPHNTSDTDTRPDVRPKTRSDVVVRPKEGVGRPDTGRGGPNGAVNGSQRASKAGDKRANRLSESWETTSSSCSDREVTNASSRGVKLIPPQFYKAASDQAQSDAPEAMKISRLQQYMTDCFPDYGMPKLEDLPAPCVISVCHVEEKGYFWAQLQNDETPYLIEVMVGLSDPDFIDSLQPYDNVSKRACAYYGNEWNRVWIQHITGSQATVFFLDWGNRADIPVSDLRCIPDLLWTLCPIALPCRMQGYIDAQELLHQTITVQTLGFTQGVLDLTL